MRGGGGGGGGLSLMFRYVLQCIANPSAASAPPPPPCAVSPSASGGGDGVVIKACRFLHAQTKLPRDLHRPACCDPHFMGWCARHCGENIISSVETCFLHMGFLHFPGLCYLKRKYVIHRNFPCQWCFVSIYVFGITTGNVIQGTILPWNIYLVSTEWEKNNKENIHFTDSLMVISFSLNLDYSLFLVNIIDSHQIPILPVIRFFQQCELTFYLKQPTMTATATVKQAIFPISLWSDRNANIFIMSYLLVGTPFVVSCIQSVSLKWLVLLLP